MSDGAELLERGAAGDAAAQRVRETRLAAHVRRHLDDPAHAPARAPRCWAEA